MRVSVSNQAAHHAERSSTHDCVAALRDREVAALEYWVALGENVADRLRSLSLRIIRRVHEIWERLPRGKSGHVCDEATRQHRSSRE